MNLSVLCQTLRRERPCHLHLKGLYASARAMLLAAVSDALARDNRPRAMIVVMDNADDAQYMYSDLHTLTDPVWYFPPPRVGAVKPPRMRRWLFNARRC